MTTPAVVYGILGVVFVALLLWRAMRPPMGQSK
jgi:ABC-type phosphate transport system permease subunit